MSGSLAVASPILSLYPEGGRYDIYDYQLARDALRNAIPSRIGGPAPSESHTANNIDGWHCWQWKEWGQKKSSIASKVANLNGCLKEKIQVLEARVRTLTVAVGCTSAAKDPLSISDPWAGGMAHRLVTKRSTTVDAHTDAWRDWRKRSSCVDNDPNENVDENMGFEHLPSVGTWFVLPVGRPKCRASQTHIVGLPLTPCPRIPWTIETDVDVAVCGLASCPLSRIVHEDISQDKGDELETLTLETSGASPLPNTLLQQSLHNVDEEGIIQRISAFRSSGWDPIVQSEVVEGAIVLADTEMPSDMIGNTVSECARGIIITCSQNLICQIAFLNKGADRLTFCTIQLPDKRVLYSIVEDEFEGEYDSE